MRSIVLLGHGSPDPRYSTGQRDLAQRIREAIAPDSVHVAYIENEPPTLADAVAGISGDIVVVPLFLANAFHARSDVPAAVAAAEERIGRPITTTPPIGTDPALLAAFDRVIASNQPAVLATAGTRDESARADLEALARHWQDQRGGPVVLAYATQAQPDIAAAVELASEHGTPAVATYLMFDSVIADRIRSASNGVLMTQPLGLTDELVSLVLERLS